MHPLVKIGLVFAFVVAVAEMGRAQDQPQGTLLTGEDLAQLLGESPITDGVYHRMNQARGSVVWESGGTMLFQYQFQSRRGGQDVGTWRIDGDRLCVALRRLTGNAETCYRYYQVGDNRFQTWTDLGVLNATLQVRL